MRANRKNQHVRNYIEKKIRQPNHRAHVMFVGKFFEQNSRANQEACVYKYVCNVTYTHIYINKFAMVYSIRYASVATLTLHKQVARKHIHVKYTHQK